MTFPLPTGINLRRKKILYLGCGDGSWPVWLASRKPQCDITAVDLLAPSSEGSVPENCHFQLVNFLNLDWPFKKRFHHIHVRAMMDENPSWQTLFSRCFNGLVEDGTIAVNDSWAPYGSNRQEINVTNSPFLQFGKKLAGSRNPQMHPFNSSRHSQLLTAAGFSEVSTREERANLRGWLDGAEGEMGESKFKGYIDLMQASGDKALIETGTMPEDGAKTLRDAMLQDVRGNAVQNGYFFSMYVFMLSFSATR